VRLDSFSLVVVLIFRFRFFRFNGSLSLVFASIREAILVIFIRFFIGLRWSFDYLFCFIWVEI